MQRIERVRAALGRFRTHALHNSESRTGGNLPLATCAGEIHGATVTALAVAIQFQSLLS
jgi:hypothetical protein